MSDFSQSILAAQNVFCGECKILASLLKNIEDYLPSILSILTHHTGNIIVSGMGKSGYIAQKIAATLTSTGSHAIYLHPAEAAHGDLGIYSKGDPSIILSKSGTSEEIVRLLPILKQFRSKIIAITANTSSPLAQVADVVVDLGMMHEDDPLGIVPTTSALGQLAVGDAIACALMVSKGFSKKDFACIHPAGQIGRNLLLSVKEIMHPLHEVACLNPETSLRKIVIALTQKALGGSLILDENTKKILGIVTDGDIRRALQINKSIDDILAEEIMTREPRVISETAYLGEALNIMESGSSQVSVLPVVNSLGEAVGLLRLHDAYRPW